MSATITSLYRVFERGNPLEIPPRPTQDVENVEGATLTAQYGLQDTFRVTRNNELLGYIRWSPDDVWIARDRGYGSVAATVKRFGTKTGAVRWLLRRPANWRER